MAEDNSKKEGRSERIFEIVKFAFEIITVVTAIISVWLVQLTLEEMQIERQNSYRPNLCVLEEQYVIIQENPSKDESSREWFRDNYDHLEVIENVQYGDDRNIALEIRNIGVGAAEDVEFTVSEEDCWRVFDEFNKGTSYSKIQYADRKQNIFISDVVTYSDGSYWDFFRFDEDVSVPYILPNAEQKCEYLLPSVYMCLVNAIVIEKRELGYSEFETIDIPDIPIVIEYRDVQGVQYQENAVIHTDIMWVLGYGFVLTISVNPVL